MQAQQTHMNEREILIERLRATTKEMASKAAVGMVLWDKHSNACLEAASALAALEAENARLREALEPFTFPDLPLTEVRPGYVSVTMAKAYVIEARAALGVREPK